MAIDAVIRLDRVRCLAESERPSEPYAWTMNLWVDDATIGSGVFVGASAPPSLHASRAIIKNGMRAGEEAAMPPVQQSFAHRFEDGLLIRHFGIVVAMFEEDGTPGDAVRAAYNAFVSEVRREIANFVRVHLRGPESDEEREEIAASVRPKVQDAGEAALSSFEKLQIFLGTLDLDDELGFDAEIAKIDDDFSSRTFTLRFEKRFTNPLLGTEIVNHYEIDGHFELRELPPPDRCQAELDRVRQERMAVDGLQANIRSLQEELRAAPPSEKPAILREIARIRSEEMPPALAKLEATRRDLAICQSMGT